MDPQLKPLLDFIREQRGIDFSAYKSASLQRRLLRRMQTVGVDSYSDYLDYLQASPDEFTPLIDTLLINVTQFFRDPEAWEALRTLVLPRILENRTHGAIRIWCGGISGGDEAYTIAMLLAEEMGTAGFRERVKIYATDVDDAELATARLATYSARQLETVPQELREKYFEEAPDGLAFRTEMRRPLIFGRHNLLEDAPISRLDLLICRNTLIYFTRDAQARIVARFHFALRDEGFLFLGRSEMLLTRRNLFVPVVGYARIFAKLPQVTLRDRLAVLTQAGTDSHGDHAPLDRVDRLRDLAFDHSAVPQIVVDANGSLALCNEAARARFSIAHGDLGRPFHDHVLSYRPLELRPRIEQAFAEQKPVVVRAVERPSPDRSTWLDIRISPLHDPAGTPLGVLISFIDVTTDRELRMQLEQSRNEIETAYEELQSTNEELETTNEELQSTIEELETTNEELQSTNEELETMNEELQSSNEDIRAINDELRERSSAVARLNAFMRSILDSVQQGVVVLDDNLHVHTWNVRAADLWGLRQDEVEGQAFLNLDIGLPVQHLRDLLRRCLRGETNAEAMHLSAHSRRGRDIDCRVTCGPLLGPDNAISGVILLMEDWNGKRRNSN